MFKISKFFFFTFAISVLFSCNNTRLLQENQRLLMRNEFVLEGGKYTLEQSRAITYDLESYTKQKPNSKFLHFWAVSGFPIRLWLYNAAANVPCNTEKTSKKYKEQLAKAIKKSEQSLKKLSQLKILRDSSNYFAQRAKISADSAVVKQIIQRGKVCDTSGLRRWALFRSGEPPVIIDTFLQKRSAIAMQHSLNNQGYFKAKVWTEQRNLQKKYAAAVYHVNAGALYTLGDSVQYVSDDAAIINILQQHRKESFLLPKKTVSSKNFELERSRVVRLLKNNGYFYFSPNAVDFEGDTVSLKKERTHIKLKILPPPDSSLHHAYRMNEVRIYTDLKPENTKIPLAAQFDTIINRNGLDYYERQHTFMRREVLEKTFQVQRDSLFRLDNYERTLKRLRDLGVYKFTEVRFANADSANLHRLNAVVNLTPAKKMEWSYNGDIRNAFSSGQALGFTGGLQFLHHNLFKGAEQLSTSVEGGIETPLDFSDTRNIAYNFRENIEISSPRLIVPYQLRDSELRYRARTRFILSHARQVQGNIDNAAIAPISFNTIGVSIKSIAASIKPFFSSNIFATSMGYEWNESPTIRHNYTPLSIALQDITASADLTGDNKFLKKSFKPTFILGSNYSITRVYANSEKKQSLKLRGNFEMSGNIPFLFSKLIRNDTFLERASSVDYSQFLRLDGEMIYYKSLSATVSFAARFATGIGATYGHSIKDELPFYKQFSVGGPNSIRAWNIRQLGAGAQINNLTTNNQTGFQTGDIKLESSVELRFDIFEMMKGAIFADAGNVWSLRPTDNNAQFNTNTFLEQIALGIGTGTRLDFSYFVLRFDLAYPIRYPYLQHYDYEINQSVPTNTMATDTHWQTPSVFFRRGWQQPTLNIAVGYPF